MFVLLLGVGGVCCVLVFLLDVLIVCYCRCLWLLFVGFVNGVVGCCCSSLLVLVVG